MTLFRSSVKNHVCNRFVSPDERVIETYWHVGGRNPSRWWEGREVFPHMLAPFIRRPLDADETGEVREVRFGDFGLVPRFAKERKVKWDTMNARSETASALTSFKAVWKARQWCVIPAWAIVEPYYRPDAGPDDRMEAWWRIGRADGAPLSVAGLWEWWYDKSKPEGDPERRVRSFTMLTINADAHPLLRRFHRHVSKAGHLEEKRTPVMVRDDQIDAWLSAAHEQVQHFLGTLQVHELAAEPLQTRGPDAGCLGSAW